MCLHVPRPPILGSVLRRTWNSGHSVAQRPVQTWARHPMSYGLGVLISKMGTTVISTSFFFFDRMHDFSSFLPIFKTHYCLYKTRIFQSLESL